MQRLVSNTSVLLINSGLGAGLAWLGPGASCGGSPRPLPGAPPPLSTRPALAALAYDGSTLAPAATVSPGTVFGTRAGPFCRLVSRRLKATALRGRGFP